MNYIKHRSEESIEDYLEAILMLQKQTGQVRSIDIANKLNFSKASVCVAMKNLREKGYVNVAANGHITLTETGEKKASCILERHIILSDWLISIGVSKKTAMEDACRIEHDLSEESFDAIKKAIGSSITS